MLMNMICSAEFIVIFLDGFSGASNLPALRPLRNTIGNHSDDDL